MATNDKTKPQAEKFALPEGRVINQSLFVKDTYVDPKTQKAGTPSYKIEIAIKKGTPGFDVEDPANPQALTVLDRIYALVDSAFPDVAKDGKENELNIFGGLIVSGILDGEKLADKREKNQKDGAAYRGHWVVRANTQFNFEGANAEGGVQVYDAEVKRIEPVNSSEVFNGCYGVVGVTLSDYTQSRSSGDENGVTFYLTAFQKTRGEASDRFAAAADNSTLFKPAGRVAGAEKPAGAGRRAKG